MPVVKLSEATTARIDRMFRGAIPATDSTVTELVEGASWDFKVKTLLDRLEATQVNGDKRI